MPETRPIAAPEALKKVARTQPPVANHEKEFNAAAHGLRGFASLAVFWAHLLGGTAEHIYSDNGVYVRLIFAPWSFGAWGVELFFSISGFVILPSIRRYSLGQFTLRRFLRLYPLFFALTLIFIALNVITNDYPETNNLKSIVSGLLFINLLTHTEQLTPNAWSLTYEVMFYALAATGFHFAVRQPKFFGMILIACLSGLFLWRYPIALFFLGGVVVRLLSERDIRPSVPMGRFAEVVLGLACIGLAGSFRFGFSQADMANSFAWWLMASTIGYFYFAVQPGSLTTAAGRNSLIAYLGTVSYSLYLVHPYTYLAARTAFQNLGLFTENWVLSMLLFFIVATPATIAVTHVAHRLLEVRVYQWFFDQRIYRGAGKT